MSKNEIIENLWNDPIINEIIKNICGKSELKEDLRSELMLILLQMPDARIKTAHSNKYLIYMAINILKKQWQSTSSPFWKTYRKFNWTEINDTNIEDVGNKGDWERDMIRKIEVIIETKLDFLDRELFKLYYKIDEYDRYFGLKRDTTCQKPISSLRKIQKKLEMISAEGKKVSISKDTIRLSLDRSRMIIKTNLKKDGYWNFDDFS